jgi:hypothetical protein
VENNNVVKKGGAGGHLHNLGHLGENDMVIHRKQQDGYFHQVLVLVFVLVHHQCLLSFSLFVFRSHKARVPLGTTTLNITCSSNSSYKMDFNGLCICSILNLFKFGIQVLNNFIFQIPLQW